MADIYVTSGGNDSSGDGSSGSPYLTISKAWTESSNGDVIIINDSSTYTVVEGGANQITTAAGALKTNLTFKAGDDCTPIFDGDGTATYCMKAWAGWTVQGLTFRNFGTSNTHNVIHQYYNHLAATIRDCTFYKITGSAASFGLDGTLYERNVIYDCTKYGLDAILARGTVVNNLIYDCRSLAISANFSTVKHNTVYNTPRRGDPDSTRSYSIRGGGVYYNIVMNSNPSIAAISAYWDHAYNCITGSSPKSNTYSTSASTGDLNTDPTFTDADAYDFTIPLTSPCVNHATNSDVTFGFAATNPPSSIPHSGSRIWDFSGKVLGTVANTYEIGCYEYNESKICGVRVLRAKKINGVADTA